MSGGEARGAERLMRPPRSNRYAVHGAGSGAFASCRLPFSDFASSSQFDDSPAIVKNLDKRFPSVVHCCDRKYSDS